MTEDEFVTMLVDTYKINKDDIPTIYATNPNAVYGIIMNSTENALGFGVYQVSSTSMIWALIQYMQRLSFMKTFII